jgi:hypothetical protein
VPSGVVMPSGVSNIGAVWGPGTPASFHGAYLPSGGFGGGLITQYTRGQAPDIACRTCHDPHGSANLYHIPATVQGTSGIAVTSGASVQSLCAACHTGTVASWHQQCADCHSSGHGTASPTAGSDCLQCHGHQKSFVHWASDPGNFSAGGCHCDVPAYTTTF